MARQIWPTSHIPGFPAPTPTLGSELTLTHTCPQSPTGYSDGMGKMQRPGLVVIGKESPDAKDVGPLCDL